MTRRKSLWIAIGALLTLASARVARANDCVWTGSSSSDWGTFQNWSTCGGTIPQSGDTASIPHVGFSPVMSNPTTADLSLLTIGSGAVVTINGGATLTLSGGLTGAGDLNVASGGTLVWSGGTMDGSGATTVGPGANLTLSGSAKTLGRSLTLNSGPDAVLTGAAWTILPGIVFHNNGTLDVRSDAGILGGGLIDNAGTLKRTTSGNVAPIQCDVFNAGAITVTSGGFDFSGNTSHGGTVDATGNGLYFDAGTHTFDNSVTAGTLVITSATATFNGSLSVSTSFQLSGTAPLVHIHAPFTSFGDTTLNAGSLIFDQGSSVATLGDVLVTGAAMLTLSGFAPVPASSVTQQGTIQGSGDLNVLGSFTWTSGLELGPGSTRLMGPSTFAGSLQAVGRGMDVGSTSNWTTGSILEPFGVPLRILGTVTIASDFTGVNGPNGVLLILPTGGLTVSPGGAPLTFEGSFSNFGAVSFGNRPTSLADYTQAAGSTTLSTSGANALSTEPGKPLQFLGGTLAGFGTIMGDVVASAGTTVSPGPTPGSPGTLTITGNYTQSAPTGFVADSIAPIPGFTDSVAVGGVASIGGPLGLAISFTPTAGNALPLMTYGSRFGTFGTLTLPVLPSGLSWTPRYAANGFSLRVQSLQPSSPLHVDAHPASAGVHNGNGVFDPGERVLVEPRWSNPSNGSIAFTGAFSNFSGPAGATYTIAKSNADYGALSPTQSADCFAATGNCYELSVDDPATRPAAHWDTTIDETESNGDLTSWTFHIGGSFSDVGQTTPQYRFVETLLHNLITSGCGGGAYCPATSVTRAQMAVFLLKARFGSSYIPPVATGVVFADVPNTGFAAAFIENLAALSVTGGCGSGNYCPNDPANRAQMAVFLLKTEGGPAYNPPPCVTSTFSDVPCSSGFAPWVEELVRRGITAGCGGGQYCPATAVTRGQMAVFLTTTFSLGLNGP